MVLDKISLSSKVGLPRVQLLFQHTLVPSEAYFVHLTHSYDRPYTKLYNTTDGVDLATK